jgi:hypothetical protein
MTTLQDEISHKINNSSEMTSCFYLHHENIHMISYNKMPPISVTSSASGKNKNKSKRNCFQEAESELYEQLLQTPIVSEDLGWLVIWIIAPYAVQRENADTERARELVKDYLDNVHKIKPLAPNPSFWLRIMNQTIETVIVEQKQKGHAIEPISTAALHRHNPLLHRELVEALAISSIDRLASHIPVGTQ